MTAAPGPTRGRMSRIQQLPTAIKDRIDELLRAGVTQRDILRRLAPTLTEAGERPLSAAGLNRYATKIERAGRRIREAREVSAALVAKFGDEPASQVSQYIIEMLRTMVYQHVALATATDEGAGEGALDADAINRLALAVQRLEGAAETSAKRERELRREAAEAAGKAARQAGVSEDTETAIRAAIEGSA